MRNETAREKKVIRRIFPYIAAIIFMLAAYLIVPARILGNPLLLVLVGILLASATQWRLKHSPPEELSSNDVARNSLPLLIGLSLLACSFLWLFLSLAEGFTTFDFDVVPPEGNAAAVTAFRGPAFAARPTVHEFGDSGNVPQAAQTHCPPI